MRLLLLLGFLAAVFSADATAQTFQLQPGDFRWVPFTVKQTPTGVNCHFEVTSGGPTVHAELLPISQFRLFDRGREHDTLAVTPKGAAAAFRSIINNRGQYAIVIVNEKGAAPVTVSLSVETNANPDNAEVSRTLSPQRRLTVIGLSFAFFIVTVTWSSRKLILAMRGDK